MTEFGKELRKLRIDRGEILKDMADKYGVTSSYLSAIECGKRSIPEKMIPWLKEEYGLTGAQARRLEEARDRSLPEVSIQFDGVSDEQRDVALKFARTFKDLTPEQTKAIEEFLNKKGAF